MLIYHKSKEEIEKLRQSALLVGETLAEVALAIKPGVTTASLDKIAEEFIRDHGATPAFKGYGGFPASLCISVNEVVVHGIPGERELKDGDIISIDCGTDLDGWIGDSAYTFPLGEVTEEVMQLLRTTKESLYEAFKVCVPGRRVGDIGYTVQTYCQKRGYGIVRELCGHGLGRKMHENPNVPNYGRRGTGVKMEKGLVIAIEPMITLGEHAVVFESDGWTCRTRDRKPAAHYEHDIAITENGCDILSSYEKIEQAIGKNKELRVV